MEAQYYREMVENCRKMEENIPLKQKKIFLFGHCNATEELADLLIERGYIPEAIVCIVTRFYESMYAQLRKLGFNGEVRKLVDYNSYAEYSLADETIERKSKRIEHGRFMIEELERKYPGYFRIFCPFSALGDLYFCMSYLPYFLKMHGKKKYVMCVAGNGSARVAALFDDCPVEVVKQNDLDAAIQAELYRKDKNAFIAHQDRPYVVNLSKALYCRKIPLEKIYCCGVFGLPQRTEPVSPTRWSTYADLKDIERNHAVILSPYAKSVTALPAEVWENIVSDYHRKGYQIFTNVSGDEKPLDGTIVKHNGYRLDGTDTLLEGAKEYIDSIPSEDKIIIVTSRTKDYRRETTEFLKIKGIRYDEILFDMPMGERIIVNDRKPSGLDMAVAFNCERDHFALPKIERKK